ETRARPLASFATTPRRGANTTDSTASPVASSTITGPAGSSARPATRPPTAPLAAPTRPDSGINTANVDVTCRAATTGATSRATIRIAPTVRTPSTTASASNPVLAASTTHVRTPATAVNPGSNVA